MSTFENTHQTQPSIHFRPEDSINGMPWFMDSNPSFEIAVYMDQKLQVWVDTAKALIQLALDTDKVHPVANQENWEIITELGQMRYRQFSQRNKGRYQTGKLSNQT